MDKKLIYTVIDTMASEYGWSIEYILRLNLDVVFELYQTIVRRKSEELKLRTKFSAIAAAVGFSGKIKELDKIFGSEKSTEEVNPEQYKEKLRAVWIHLRKNPAEFETAYNSGKVVF